VTAGPHLDEETLSASIDGEASAEEEAHVAACAACRGRRDNLAAAAAAVRRATVDPRPPAEVASAVSRALLRGLEVPAGSSAAASAPRPRPAPASSPAVTHVAARRRRPITVALATASAAAAVAAIVFGALSIHPGRSVTAGSSSGASSAATRSSASGQTGTASSGSGSPAPHASPTSGAVSLGSYPSPGPLAAALHRRLAPMAGATARAPGSPEAAAAVLGSCQAAVTARAQEPAGAVPVLAGRLTYQGQPAAVAVYRSGGTLVAVVADIPGCEVVAVLHP
jgi:hypothetical protein